MTSAPAPIAVGIIGYRGFGAFCTEAFHESGVGRVVAYAGRDAAAMDAAARKYGVSHTYTDWHDLISDPAVQLVQIVTPPSLHAEMARAALRAGKHVFVEKPLATTDADARAILDAAAGTGRTVGINYVMRYAPLYQMVAQIAKSGALGSLTHAGFENYASDEGLGDDHWFWNPALSGGIFVEHGVHFFDIIGSLMNAPAAGVTARTWTRADGKEDRVQAIVTYGNGQEASFYHAFNRPGALERQTAHFAFHRGHIVLNGWIPTALHLTAVVSEGDIDILRAIVPVTVTEDFGSKTMRGNGNSYPVRYRVTSHMDLGDPTPLYKTAVADALFDLAAAIRGPAHTPRVTGEDGATSLVVATAARQSAAEGRPVSL